MTPDGPSPGQGGSDIVRLRLARIFSRQAAAAGFRRIGRFWPLWLSGLGLAFLAALTVDSRAVIWARELPPPVRAIFEVITELGRTHWLLLPPGILCIMLLMADWRRTHRRIAAAWMELGTFCFYFFISVASAQMLTGIIKQFVGRGRPVLFDEHGAFSRLPFEFSDANASFPSGHATNLAAAAVVFASAFPRLFWVWMLVFGFLATSRVIVSAHYPSDVIAGFVVGGVCAVFWGAEIRLKTEGLRWVFRQQGGVRRALDGLGTALWRRREG